MSNYDDVKIYDNICIFSLLNHKEIKQDILDNLIMGESIVSTQGKQLVKTDFHLKKKKNQNGLKY